MRLLVLKYTSACARRLELTIGLSSKDQFDGGSFIFFERAHRLNVSFFQLLCRYLAGSMGKVMFVSAPELLRYGTQHRLLPAHCGLSTYLPDAAVAAYLTVIRRSREILSLTNSKIEVPRRH